MKSHNNISNKNKSGTQHWRDQKI